MMSFVTFRDLHRDVAAFAARFHGQIDLVAGAPRSGTLIANLIALHLNVPCTTVEGLQRGEVWTAGPRLRRPLQAKPRVLLVDDSALSGSAMMNALASGPFAWPIVKIGVLYASPKIAQMWGKDTGRTFLRVVPSPRVFAWNFAHAAQTGHLAFDFDGVLCHDPTVAEDNEAGYVQAITNARPLYVPTWPIGGIATHRLERRRPIVREWLKRHGIAVRPGNEANVVMHPARTCKDRRARGDQDGTWKGTVYKARAIWRLFIESDPKQAARIRAVSGKPVYCPATDQFWGA